MPRITVIPQTVNPQTRLSAIEVVKRKVTGYARVSTDLEEQITSYQAQRKYYTEYIQKNPDWEFAGMYTDEGISATSTRHREGFNQMIKDALDGKIDLIITKSVSRFARNTVDSLTTIRKLKENNVECYFEKENIWTFQSSGELLLTIMSSLAQEESRSISENVTWGQRRRMAEGKVSLPYAKFLGYKKGENGLPEIVPEEAEVVRLIYKLFIDGMTPYYIAKELTRREIPTPGGKKIWAGRTIESILTNEKYKGDALLQKKFTVDFLTKRQKINEGEVPQYYVEHSHPAIISPKEFDLVQTELERQKEINYSGMSLFSSRIICGDCGSFYGSKVWHSTSKYRRTIWQCNSKFKGEHFCSTPHLYEAEIKAKFLNAFAKYYNRRKEIIKNLKMVLAALQEPFQPDDTELRTLEAELEGYIATHTNGFTDEYRKKYERFEELQSELDREKAEYESAQARYKQIQDIIQTLKDDVLTEFDDRVWNAVIANVTVFHDGSMVFQFKDGTEIKE